MRSINEIIVHCSATRPDWLSSMSPAAQVEEIRRWHRERGWKDIGYHYVVARNGAVLPGRPIEQVGAHVKGHNTGTIGVCLIGGHGSAETDQFLDNFTREQELALRSLISELRRRYPAIEKVSGHNQYAAKACPGFNVPLWYGAQKEAPQAAAGPAPERTKLSAWLERILAAVKG